MLTQRPIGALIRIARARSNGGSISNAVRQIWALRAPVIPLRAPVILLRTPIILLRAPALRRRHRPSPGGARAGPALGMSHRGTTGTSANWGWGGVGL